MAAIKVPESNPQKLTLTPNLQCAHSVTVITVAGGGERGRRADQLLDEGDIAGAETWHRILNAIERLQAKAPAEGEKVH